ncbi:hypothetical protein N752_26560 [Desulforamulus aquiferis]|nr:YkgJ family cysteine cluster protein [Desulforamulus aquiferis]RYD02018.1 hypothetical protein N752_26560 [Desulforamulus aquiferis]
MSIKVFKDSGSKGYDLEILDPSATVQDYLDALNNFIDTNMSSPCRGCDECCWERIPLTSVDVFKYIETSSKELKLGSENLLLEFLKKYCYIYVEGRVVDISLGFTLEGACSFLNQTQKICSNYLARSLVCQSFVCLESSERPRI